MDHYRPYEDQVHCTERFFGLLDSISTSLPIQCTGAFSDGIETVILSVHHVIPARQFWPWGLQGEMFRTGLGSFTKLFRAAVVESIWLPYAVDDLNVSEPTLRPKNDVYPTCLILYLVPGS